MKSNFIYNENQGIDYTRDTITPIFDNYHLNATQNVNLSSTPATKTNYRNFLNGNNIYAISQTPISPPQCVQYTNTQYFQTPNENYYYGCNTTNYTPITETTPSDSAYFSRSHLYLDDSRVLVNSVRHGSTSYDDSCYNSMNTSPQYARVNNENNKRFTIDSILNDNFKTREKPQNDSNSHIETNNYKKESKNSKRIRTIFTQDQLDKLEIEFTRQQYMVGSERYYLANELNLSEAQVKIWFQNRRIKWRKENVQQQRHFLAQQKNDNNQEMFTSNSPVSYESTECQDDTN